MLRQFRWVEYLNTLVTKLIHGLKEFQGQAESISLGQPLKYTHTMRVLCMDVKHRADILKFWMEHELRDPESFAGNRYKLFRIFPNIHHLRHPGSQLRRQRFGGTYRAPTLSKFWDKKNQ